MDNEKTFWDAVGNDGEVFLSTSADSSDSGDSGDSDDSEEASSSGETLSGNTLTIDDDFSGNVDLTSKGYSSVVSVNATKVTRNLKITGNTNNNSIEGGSGHNTLEGGNGDNTLIGGESRDYFVHTGTGLDRASNFVGGKDSDSDVAVINRAVSAVLRTGSTTLIMNDEDDGLEINTSSEVIQYSSKAGGAVMSAKISASDSVDYESGITYYCTGVDEGTLNVTDSRSVAIWLDGSLGEYFGNITDINATNSEGQNLLAGDGQENVIIAGAGETSLWGGSGAVSDTLIGGTAIDMFWYGKYDGNDIVMNASALDTVNLYDVTLADIAGTFSDGQLLGIVFSNGNGLLINDTDSLSAKIQLADGSAYAYNHETQTWQSA